MLREGWGGEGAAAEVALAYYRPGATLREVGQKVDTMLKARGLDAYAQDFSRIEDTVAITDTGHEVLSVSVPRRSPRSRR